jgi:hypothetical protein
MVVVIFITSSLYGDIIMFASQLGSLLAFATTLPFKVEFNFYSRFAID